MRAEDSAEAILFSLTAPVRANVARRQLQEAAES